MISSAEDYISLNVPGLLRRYENPTKDWPAKVLALAKTQLDLFTVYGLIREDASPLREPLETAVVRFSDYTPLGQAFVKSGEVERWLASCDRKNSVAAYQDPNPLERRIKKFLGTGRDH